MARIGVRYELPSFSVVKGALLKLHYDHIDTDGGPGERRSRSDRQPEKSDCSTHG
jgi:hypothetical protein